MDITTLTSADFRKIQKLLLAKEKLLARVEAINSQLTSFGGNGAAPRSKIGRRKSTPTKASGGKRGKTKELVIAELKAAGKTGVHVKALAKKLGLNLASLSVWFYSTGKKFKEIKKVAPATYGWVE